METIDFGPILVQVIYPALSIVALAIAGYLAKKIANNADEKTQANIRDLVNGALQAGLQAAQAKVASSNLEKVEVQQGILTDALRYATANVPDGLKRLGIDVTSDAGQKEIYQKLESLLAPAVMVAVSSPVAVSVATAATIANSEIPTVTTAVPDASAVASAGGSIAEQTMGANPPTA